jgi:DNA repair protein RadA/Sms
VLYVTAEESEAQIKMRGERLGIRGEALLILAEVDLEAILQNCRETAPRLVIVDSIQTVFSRMMDSLPGSISQVKEAASRLMIFAKEKNISVFLIGHITKDGAIAGPKSLEHMVDTVLYFEGEKNHVYRVLRTVKNRFGPANELGIFEMMQDGLSPVENPSGLFLKERRQGTPGTVILACLEGSRPFLVELQALVTPSAYGTPRRMATGVDYNRVSLLLAVMEKKLGLHFGQHDVFVNVVGGMTLTEPAADLGIVLAVASSFKNRVIDPGVAVFGEVGLTGEVRSAQGAAIRLKEASNMGFKRCLLPSGTPAREVFDRDVERIRVGSIGEAVDKLL